MTWAVAVAARVAEIVAALEELDQVHVYSKLITRADPPAVVLGPLTFTWEGFCGEPTGAQMTMWAVVAQNEWSVAAVYELLPRVTAVFDGVTDMVITKAEPASFPGASGPLPGYAITLELTL